MPDLSSYSLPQLAQLLSALEGARRNPNSKSTALKAIERNAAAIGLGAGDVLAAAGGLLDGRLSPAQWRATLAADAHPDAAGIESATGAAGPDRDAPSAATAALEAEPVEADPEAREPAADVATEPMIDIHDLHTSDHPIACANAASWPAGSARCAQDAATPSVKQQLLAACQAAARALHEHEIAADTLQLLRAAIARAEQRRAGGSGSKRPRGDTTKQARLIAMLQRGATISEMISELGWLRHTCHGALAGLKKRGLDIVSDKRDGERLYRIAQ